MSISTETPKSTCPNCGYEMDRATGAFEDAVPGEGDLSICMQCCHVLTFNKDLTLRHLTEEETQALPPETVAELNRVSVAIMQGKMSGRGL